MSDDKPLRVYAGYIAALEEDGKGTLRAIIRDIDLSMEEFIALLG